MKKLLALSLLTISCAGYAQSIDVSNLIKDNEITLHMSSNAIACFDNKGLIKSISNNGHQVNGMVFPSYDDVTNLKLDTKFEVQTINSVLANRTCVKALENSKDSMIVVRYDNESVNLNLKAIN